MRRARPGKKGRRTPARRFASIAARSAMNFCITHTSKVRLYVYFQSYQHFASASDKVHILLSAAAGTILHFAFSLVGFHIL